MPTRQLKSQQYAVCIRNGGYQASLEVRKLYPVVYDSDAEAKNLIRVIDESGEDYVYPSDFFQRLTLPAEVERALRLASPMRGRRGSALAAPQRLPSNRMKSVNYIGPASARLRSHAGSTSAAPPFAVFLQRPDEEAPQ
jgi:hypothetical protein